MFSLNVYHSIFYNLAKITSILESEQATLAFYNVENFYANASRKEDTFLPSNWSKWIENRYEQKVSKIAYTIAKIGLKETGKLPLLVGLSEVENESVLKDLVQDENLIRGNYETILFESLDERKINVGCIYQKDLIEIIKAEPIRVVFKNQLNELSYTRDILFLKTKLKEEVVYFFIIHLPSKIDLEINQNKRAILLQKIKDKIEEINKVENNPNVIVMGDFNDSPTADNIRLILNTNPSIEQLKDDELYNPMVSLMSYKRGSLVHKKQWMLFDQMLFSNGFSSKNSTIKVLNTEIFDQPFLTVNTSKYGAFPQRTFVGTKYLGGYSDHFPIYTVIKY